MVTSKGSSKRRLRTAASILKEADDIVAKIPKRKPRTTPVRLMSEKGLNLPPMTKAEIAKSRKALVNLRGHDRIAAKHGMLTFAQILGSEKLARDFLYNP